MPSLRGVRLSIAAISTLLTTCSTGITTKVPTPEPLPAIEHERLRYALDVVSVFKKAWHMREDAPICITLLKAAQQWVVHCEEPQKTGDLVATGTHAFSMPVYFAKPLQLPGGAGTPPEGILKSGQVAFSLFGIRGMPSWSTYGSQPWFIVSSIDDLVSLSPSFKDEHTELWTAIFLHEYFHVLQFTHPSIQLHFERYVTTAQGAFNEHTLDALYRDNADYRAAVTQEYELMDAALLKGARLTKSGARSALKRWLKLYNARTKRFAALYTKGDLRTWDSFWTFIEGTANFAGNRYALDLQYRAIAPPAGDDHFDGFKEYVVGKGYAGLPAQRRKLKAHYYYMIGYQLTELLEKIDPSWNTKVMSTSGWLLGYIEEKCKN